MCAIYSFMDYMSYWCLYRKVSDKTMPLRDDTYIHCIGKDKKKNCNSVSIDRSVGIFVGSDMQPGYVLQYDSIDG